MATRRTKKNDPISEIRTKVEKAASEVSTQAKRLAAEVGANGGTTKQKRSAAGVKARCDA